MTTAPTVERKEFQTEVRELLQLMIHSLYSHKEIFLRELVSNSADALDKLRFQAISQPQLLSGDTDLRIDIALDSKLRLVKISDNGIGMNHDELVENLGTIARSGTRNFMQNLSGDCKKDLSLIGQFGVGFYSAFMVASKVEVRSRKAGEEEGWLWASDGSGEYTIEPCPKSNRGTEIHIFLKEGEDFNEFAQEWRIRSILKKYSEFVVHPLFIKGDKEDSQAERVNEKPALWRQNPKEVEEAQHKEFFGHLSYDGVSPLAWSHTHVEGTAEFHSLLYIPSKAPFNIYNEERAHGLKLYVRRVFIMDDCKDLLPTWLRFVRGVVDSEDLPLNVSREILQSNKMVSQIRKHVVKKVLDTLADVANSRPSDYIAFWKELGSVLKEGFHMNWEYLDELKELLRFPSTHLEDGSYTSLKDYAGRMREGQKDIYWVAGGNRATLENSPHLEALRSRGYEVLLLTESIDEWMMRSVDAYKEYKFCDVSRGNVELERTEEEKQKEEKVKKEFGDFCQELGKLLATEVKEVRTSSLLKDSPCRLVTPEDGLSPQMERIMELTKQSTEKSKRILELNPDHPVVQGLFRRVENKQDLESWPKLIYWQALLAEGSPLPDPGTYAKEMGKVLGKLF